MTEKRKSWGLFRRREILLPTWRGCLLALVLILVAGTFVLWRLAPFLSVTERVEDGLLVVEGWDRDQSMQEVVAEFRRRPQGKVYVTGGPLEVGSFLSEYRTYAQRGAAVLVSLGLGTNDVQAVPAPVVRRDRTYTSAVALARWFRDHGIEARRIELMTEGPHARRSRLMFQKAFGPGVRVGIISIPPPDYDAKHWWRSSMGVRTVVSEGVGWIYGRFLFWTSGSGQDPGQG